jgi:hypothetical protein
MFQI